MTTAVNVAPLTRQPNKLILSAHFREARRKYEQRNISLSNSNSFTDFLKTGRKRANTFNPKLLIISEDTSSVIPRVPKEPNHLETGTFHGPPRTLVLKSRTAPVIIGTFGSTRPSATLPQPSSGANAMATPSIIGGKTMPLKSTISSVKTSLTSTRCFGRAC